MGLIIDSGVFIKWEKTGRTVDFSQWEEEGNASISVATVTELLVGVQRADTQARREKRSAFVEAIFSLLPILDFTPAVARVHAGLYATLASQGQIIGAHDLIIAATAKYHQSALLTTNVAEFQRVPDLKVIEFQTPS